MNSHTITFEGETIVLESEVEQLLSNPGRWRVTLRVVSNTIGPVEMFVINHPLDKFLAVASPMLEDATPAAPAVNKKGEQRLSQIRFVHPVGQLADQAVTGVINDLDEYLRSKVTFRDRMTAQKRYTFRPTNA